MDPDYEDQSDLDEESSTVTPAYLFVAVDCNHNMFEDQLGDNSLFKAVLTTCYNLLDSALLEGGHRGGSRIAIGVVSEDKDKMAISDFKRNVPSVLKQLKTLCDTPDVALKQRYVREGLLNFGGFLLNVREKFKSLPGDAPKYIAYISNDDNPVLGDDDKIYQAVNQAKALIDNQIKFELVTFREQFKFETFFKEILYSCNCKFNYEYLTDTISLQDKLLTLLGTQGKRVKFYMFPADKTSYFDVIEKVYIKELKILNNTMVRRGDLKEVKEIKTAEDSSGQYTAKYRNNLETLLFDETERNKYLNDEVPMGFTLIGTSSGLIEPGLHLTDPKFLQENKQSSNPLFRTLWQYCKDKNRTLICSRKYYKHHAPYVTELSPYIINNTRSFLVLGIPFYNDLQEQNVHNPLYQQKPTENDALMEAAEKFVEAASFDYDPLQFHDTVMCRKWEYVRSELLEEPARPVEEVLDVKPAGGEEVEKLAEELSKFVRLNEKKRKGAPKKKETKK